MLAIEFCCHNHDDEVDKNNDDDNGDDGDDIFLWQSDLVDKEGSMPHGQFSVSICSAIFDWKKRKTEACHS